MTVSVTFRKDAKINHINIRKEGQEGAEQVAVDLKITGLASIGQGGEMLDKLMGCEPGHSRSLWARPTVSLEAISKGENEGPEVAFHGLSSISCWAEYDSKHVIKICGMTLRPKRVSKFKITPRPGYLVDLECLVSITGIEERQLNILVEHLKDEIHCELLADPDLFDSIDQPTADEEDADDTRVDSDPMFYGAVVYVRESGKASIASLQREMKIGYNRAARLIEQMEAAGVVTPPDASGKRSVVPGGGVQ